LAHAALHRDFRSPLTLLAVLVRQACHELRVRRLRGIAFRTSRNDDARRAYAALRLWEFEGINERQAWANWRTIRRNLQGRAPRRPVSAIDLCCGTGDSTEVLAWCLEPGSAILGVDADPRFVAAGAREGVLSRGAVGPPTSASAASPCWSRSATRRTSRSPTRAWTS
jgi:hypothetical protein